MTTTFQPQIDDIKVHQLIAPISTTDTTSTSAAVNRQTSQSGAVSFVFQVGTMATNGVVTVSLTESATLGGAYTTVATADLSVALVTFVAASDAGKYQAVSYLGSRAFVKAVMVTSGTAACLIAATALEVRGNKPAGVTGKVVTTA